MSIVNGTSMTLLQDLSVRRNDPLVPPEALLTATGIAAVAVIIKVHVYEAIPLAHLAGGERDQIDAAPGGVTHDLHTIGDGGGNGLDVAAKVVDARDKSRFSDCLKRLNEKIGDLNTLINTISWFLLSITFNKFTNICISNL